jgi:hypothetical protein
VWAGLFSVSPHETEEPAFFSLAGLVLIQERQLLIIESLEEFVPVNILELVAVAEFHPQKAFAIRSLGARASEIRFRDSSSKPSRPTLGRTTQVRERVFWPALSARAGA